MLTRIETLAIVSSPIFACRSFANSSSASVFRPVVNTAASPRWPSARGFRSSPIAPPADGLASVCTVRWRWQVRNLRRFAQVTSSEHGSLPTEPFRDVGEATEAHVAEHEHAPLQGRERRFPVQDVPPTIPIFRLLPHASLGKTPCCTGRHAGVQYTQGARKAP